MTVRDVDTGRRTQRLDRAVVLAADFGVDLDQHVIGAPEVAA
ncbi:hypothetical protein [Streptomyces sasae]|nr:hypothetical protein [Streptomyces sasae]